MELRALKRQPAEPPVVVLIHGLYMHGITMALLARALHKEGYRPVAFSYPSLWRAPRENAVRLRDFIQRLDNGTVHTVHLLAHSLGGLLVRHLFSLPNQLPAGRIVTLGTPHNSSSVARSLDRHRLGLILGRSLEAGLLGPIPAWSGERDLGSLAGTRNLGLGRLISRLPGPADGAVTVEETRLPGMADHICLPVSHIQMVSSAAVVAQACTFFETGRFNHFA